MPSQRPTCLRWLLDVNALWPGNTIDEAAPAALALISDAERESIRRRYFVQDARMALGSALLKRLFLCRALGEPWDTAGRRFGRRGDPTHGKPCVVATHSGQVVGQPLAREGVDFNVSHQAGLVVLVGWVAANGSEDAVEVGIDIVCVNERDDIGRIESGGGFARWLTGFDQFFAPAELRDLTDSVDAVRLPDGRVVSGTDIDQGTHGGVRCCRRDVELRLRRCVDAAGVDGDGRHDTFPSAALVDAKLRRFYAFYAYREAFIKLTGDALLAPWLRDLELRHVRAPAPAEASGTRWGEVMRDDELEIWLKRERVADVRTELRAFGERIMIATAVRGAVDLPEFDMVQMQRELAEYAYQGG